MIQIKRLMSFNIRIAVIPIIMINIILFILQTVLGRGFYSHFVLVSGDIFVRPWILITHMFLHADGYHILFNMFGLYIFGLILEQRIGAKRFLFIYLLSGIIAGLLYSLFYNFILQKNVIALGASAAVLGMLGVMIILLPHMKLLFFFVIPMPLWIAGIVWTAMDIFGIIFPSGTGNIAHLLGLGCGLLYGLYLKKKKSKFHKRFIKKSHIDAEDMEEFIRTGRI